MEPKAISTYFLFILIAASMVFTIQIFMPFLSPLALAAAFSAVLQPVFLSLRRHLKGRGGPAALLTLLIVLVGILAPLAFILILVGSEAAKLYSSISDGSFAAIAASFFKHVQESLPQSGLGANFSDGLAGNLSTYAREALGWISGHVTDAFSSFASILINLFIFFVALFFFLRDGESLKSAIIELSPLHDRDDEIIFDRLSLAVNSVIRGNLLIALIRGVFAGIGFIFFGVPNPLLWGIVSGIAGLIPGIGITLVFAPAILYIYFFVGTLPAIGLLLWGLFVVGLIDNALAPRLVGSGMQVHPLFVLLAIFGGISYFGAVGIFLGPLTLTLLFALLSIYSSPRKHVK